MRDQAHTAEAVSVTKESVSVREMLGLTTDLMRKHVGDTKYVTWLAQLKADYVYVRIARVSGQEAHEIYLSIDWYTSGQHDFIDRELGRLVEDFMNACNA